MRAWAVTGDYIKLIICYPMLLPLEWMESYTLQVIVTGAKCYYGRQWVNLLSNAYVDFVFNTAMITVHSVCVHNVGLFAFCCLESSLV